MTFDPSRSRWILRWFYTRHFLGQLGPIALVIFVLSGLAVAAITFWTLAACVVTFGTAPWCA